MYATGINMVHVLIYGWVVIRQCECSVFTHFYVCVICTAQYRDALT